MKNYIKKITREKLLQFDEYSNPLYIVIIGEKKDTRATDNLIIENWVPSPVKGYWQRVDTPKFDHEQLHVHIARSKHITAKNKQVSWNQDGSRHDKKSFNDNFTGMEKAKQIARNALNLPSDKILEYVEDNAGKLILENIENLERKSRVYIFKISNN